MRSRSPRWVTSASIASVSSTAAWTSSRLGAPAEPPTDQLGAQQVTVAGDRAQPGVGLDGRPGLVEVVDEHDAVEQPGERGQQRLGARTLSSR